MPTIPTDSATELLGGLSSQRPNGQAPSVLARNPTNSKKRALMPSTPLRRMLRSRGHALVALVQIGKDGASRALLAQLQHTLFDHELVKVKLAAECPQDRFAIADRLAEQPGVSVVQILGRTLLVYKRHPQSPRFEGKRAKVDAPAI